FTDRPCQASSCGAIGTRSRWGLMPYSPHHAAGMRIEPRPSEPTPIPTIPDATAAAVPPDEPPVVRSTSHGLRVAPKVIVSVKGQIVSSGTLVLPSTT